jgi:hypothetical protein
MWRPTGVFSNVLQDVLIECWQIKIPNKSEKKLPANWKQGDQFSQWPTMSVYLSGSSYHFLQAPHFYQTT